MTDFTKKMITRRNLLTGIGALLAAPAVVGKASADEIILRPKMDGVDKNYADYATQGPFLQPESPAIFLYNGFRVYAYYPLGVSKAQVIVFSHGALGDPSLYGDLLRHWTSHGFIVMAPVHDDAIIKYGPSLRRRTDGQLSEWPVTKLLEDTTAWNNRLLACRGCLDMAEPIKEKTEIEIDFSRPVIAGHGYGAYIAAIATGTTVVDKSQNRLSFRDTRFYSAIELSPQGPGVMGLDEQSWKDVSSPVLGIVAEHEADFTKQTWQQKGQGFKLSMPGYKHFGMVKDGGNNSFTGQMAGASAQDGQAFIAVKAFSTAFLQAYADFDPVAFKDLTTNYFQRNSLGAVQEFRR